MSSDRRGRKDRGYDKHQSKRPKRGINANDIEKLKTKQIRIIEFSNNNNLNFTQLYDEIQTKESDKTIQQHQKTRTLFKSQQISVPDFEIIRHELPNKSLNPSIKTINKEKFILSSSYIQYSTIPDRGSVSFHDFYDLKKEDIDWLIKELSINDDHLKNKINKKYQKEQRKYDHKLKELEKKKTLKEKENSVLSQNSSHSNSLSNDGLNGFGSHKKRHKTRSNSPRKDKRYFFFLFFYFFYFCYPCTQIKNKK